MEKPSAKYHLRPTNPDLLLQNKNREESSLPIEFIPVERTCFEMISFIEFGLATENQYIASDITKKRDKNIEIFLFIKNPTNVLESERYCFHILFGQGLTFIKVFMKYFINNYSIILENGEYLLELNHDIHPNKFENPISKLNKNSLITKVANYFTDKRHPCPECARKLFVQYSKNPNVQKIDINNQTIEQILSMCPGNIRLTYGISKNDGNDSQEVLKTLSILFPWSIEIFEKLHYIEIDGSFHAMDPYVYCVTQGIVFNESIPLGITVTATESVELYDLFYDHINQLSLATLNWQKKAVLSDMGEALISYCSRHDLLQFFCHRHIIQHFGSSCVLGIFCARLLRCFSYDQYQKMCIEIKCELKRYVEERKELGILSEEFNKKVDDLMIMLNGDNADPKSNYFVHKWSLWIRRDFNVARCSNHNESLHGVLNDALGQSYSLKAKIFNLFTTTLKHCENLENRKGQSIRRKVKKIIIKIIQKIQDRRFNIENLCLNNCKCEENIYNEKIYGCQIPCFHCILKPACTIINIIKDHLSINKKGITIRYLLKIILNNKMFLESLNSGKNQPLIDDILKQLNDVLDKDLTFYIKSLISVLQGCFRFKPPQMPTINTTLYKNEVIPKKTKDIVVFKSKPGSKPPPPSLFEFEKGQEEDLLNKEHECKKKKYKNALFETVHEIITVYKNMISYPDAFEICFDQYNKYFVAQKEDGIIELIANFKIECWKKADQEMNSNKFFK